MKIVSLFHLNILDLQIMLKEITANTIFEEYISERWLLSDASYAFSNHTVEGFESKNRIHV